MVLFEKMGKVNTLAALRIAVEKAIEMDTDIVIASATGESALELIEMAAGMDFNGKIVVVRTASTADSKGANDMSKECKAKIEELGARVVTAAHALSAGERGISSTYKGQYPLELMADTLRMFGQGTKVCVECSVMALDADEIEFNKPIVAAAGTDCGIDTAVVITPSYASTILRTAIHEMLCKPAMYK